MAYDSDERTAARLREETRSLIGWLVVLLGDRDLADEAFQDVCLEVWKVRSRFREGEDFGAWARGVAKNVVLRLRRQQHRRRVTSWSPELMERLAATWREKEESALETERRQALEHCLDALGPEHRDVLRRIYRDHASHAVVASETGRTADAVKMLALRLRSKLKDCVGRRLKQEEFDVL